ncbi:M3 family metallopeptidase [Ahrensia marina]|uniref:Peptidase M3 n=1 Tax=Ahrensia marina TaxID=1514904 RepID=A0A0M9GKV0_9HYPH|nr:M3 family metallopeptidase [Ahrensia marina]KPB00093.1 peptidase M3 [Ahrensia marina]
MTEQTINPAITTWDGPFGMPRFDAIKDEDFGPAMREGFKVDLAQAEEIAGNPDAPTFENTIEALERTGEILSRAATLFFVKAGNDTNATIQKLEREFSPLFARHAGEMAKNKKLFQRIDTLWNKRGELGLSVEQTQLLKKYHRNFVRMGAALEGEEQQKLIAVNEKLAALGTQFGQNVLKDEAEWVMYLGEDDLSGLPASLKDAMASEATSREKDGQYAVTLSRSLVSPFLTHSDRRDLREKAYKAWIARGENDGESDNRPIITQTLKLRAQRAKLLGHENFAALKLDGTMAKTPQAVNELLETVWEKAKTRAEEEAADIEALMRENGDNADLAGWDWRYYAEKIRVARFAYSDDEVRPYMRLENMIEAAFSVAGRLFGLTFEEKQDIPLYHPDARIWEVKNANGEHQAMFIGDYFARPSKRSGAWMSAMQYQSKLLGKSAIITNTMNFAKPPKGQEAYLSFDDARTLFHEFGHALHGMLSNVTYPSLSGTSVSRDFVELPSQLYEHWMTVPEVMNEFATHKETGKPMPKALLDKVLAATTFNIGHDTVEYTTSALVDMAYHQNDLELDNPAAFEADLLAKIGKPAPIAMRHRSPHFQHIFSGDGYAAGYYSYMWSEVLDADAFLAFEEKGDAFDPELAKRLLDNIYSSGATMEPEDAYIGFRGKLPTPDAMLKGRGLI